MPIPVIVNGAQGKMGRLACDTLRRHPHFELAAELGRADDLGQAIAKTEAQIVVELTRADCVYENSITIIKHKAHPVIGATGLMPEQIASLQKQCEQKKLGGIIVPNFSIGAVLMMHFASIAARFLPEVEIVETHHPQKLDAPSGTAMKTAEMINAARAETPVANASKTLVSGARGAQYQNVHIHSIRLPGVVARQEVVFGQTGETLTLLHNSIDRISFMPGLILACEQVTALTSLYYGLEHLLSL